MNRLPPLKAVRVFEAAARFQSFNSAADALSVTPSAVSHQVKSLEEYLGIKLFKRLNRKVVLTPEGRAYLTPIRDALEQIRVATERIRCTEAAGAITLSVAPSFATGWLTPRLPQLQLDHPEIEVRLISAIELVDFADSDLDAAIRSGRGLWQGLRSHRLLAEELIPICKPDLAQGELRLRCLEDLRHATLLHEIPRLGLWRSWLTAVGVVDVDAERGPKFQGAAMAVEAAVAGLGVAIANRPLVEAHLRDGRLVIPFDIELPSDSAYYLVYPQENRTVVVNENTFEAHLLVQLHRLVHVDVSGINELFMKPGHRARYVAEVHVKNLLARTEVADRLINIVFHLGKGSLAEFDGIVVTGIHLGQAAKRRVVSKESRDAGNLLDGGVVGMDAEPDALFFGHRRHGLDPVFEVLPHLFLAVGAMGRFRRMIASHDRPFAGGPELLARCFVENVPDLLKIERCGLRSAPDRHGSRPPDAGRHPVVCEDRNACPSHVADFGN